MALKTWTFTDVEKEIFVEQADIGPRVLTGAAGACRATKRTLHGGLREGVEIVELDNGRLRLVVLPTRGMGIWRVDCNRLRLGWSSPVRGPVHPAFVNLWEPGGIGWLSGFDELLVRCGLASNGAPEFRPDGALRYPLHGKIANTPAHKVELSIDEEQGEIRLTGVVDEARLFGAKLRLVSTIAMRAGEPAFAVRDEVINLSAEPGEMELLYHINFGPPLAAPGAEVFLPVKRLAPRDAIAAAEIDRWRSYGPESPGAPEVCYFFDLVADASGCVPTLLQSADGKQGVCIKFIKHTLPCFTLWKNRHAIADGYVTGLEPATNFPNRRSFEKEHHRVVQLSPGESRRFEVRIEVCEDAAVAAVRETIQHLQAGVQPEILSSPDPNWSAE